MRFLKRSLFLAAVLALGGPARSATVVPPLGVLRLDVAPPLSPNLSTLRDKGFAVLSPGTMMDPVLERRAIAEFPRWKEAADPVTGMVHLVSARSGKWSAFQLQRHDPDGRLVALVNRVTAQLRQALPGEDFDLSQVQMRAVENESPFGDDIHVDGGYVTATYAFIGPGTVIYAPEQSGGAVSEMPAEAGRWAVISNSQRETFLGRPIGTVHSAPRRTISRRLMLLARYKNDRLKNDLTETTLRRKDFVSRALDFVAAGIPGR